jgi:hypothetical protein
MPGVSVGLAGGTVGIGSLNWLDDWHFGSFRKTENLSLKADLNSRRRLPTRELESHVRNWRAQC